MLAPPNGIQIKDKKHGEDQTKSAGRSERPPGRHFATSGRRRRREDKDSPERDPRVRVGQEDQARVFWKLSVFEERAIDCPKPLDGAEDRCRAAGAAATGVAVALAGRRGFGSGTDGSKENVSSRWFGRPQPARPSTLALT